MDSIDYGTLGLIIVTLATPLLAPLADDLRKQRLVRRTVPKRAIASRQTRSQAHPMADTRRT